MGRPALVAHARRKFFRFHLHGQRSTILMGIHLLVGVGPTIFFKNFGSGQRSRIELKNKSLKHHTGLFIFNYFFSQKC